MLVSGVRTCTHRHQPKRIPRSLAKGKKVHLVLIAEDVGSSIGAARPAYFSSIRMEMACNMTWVNILNNIVDLQADK